MLAIDGSPSGAGRTRRAVDAVTSAAAAAGAAVETVELAVPEGAERALDLLAGAQAVIVGSPVYRAAEAAPLKALLDRIPRQNDPERSSPVGAKAIAIVQTGASLHHFLALDGLRAVFAGFFAAHVVPPGLYVPREGFDEAGGLAEPYAEDARRQGEALVGLAQAIAASPALAAVRPQA
ncbi:MAG: NAD(P)H-dependent oxidoreductase [Actinomycetota bacterium]